MEPGVEAGINRTAKFTVEGFVGRNCLSAEKFLDSRFHGNDGKLEHATSLAGNAKCLG
jgi:hypothetical protein